MAQGRLMHKGLYKAFVFLLNNLKIRTKLFLFLAISIVTFTILLSFVMFKKMENVLNRETGNSMMQVLDQINNNIDYNINEFEISMKSFYAGDRFDALVPEVINDYNDMLLYFEAVRNQITTFRNVNEDINDLRVFSFDDKIPWDNAAIFSASEISNDPWVKPLLKFSPLGRFYWTNEKDGTWSKLSDKPLLSCYSTVFNDLDQRPMAILRLDVSTQRIFSSIDTVTFGKSGMVFTAKDTGDLIYYDSSKKQYLGDYASKISEVVAKGDRKGAFTATIGGQQEFLVYSNNNKLGWYVIGSMPQKEFKEKTNGIRDFIFVLSLGLCTLGFIGTFLFSKLVTKRITMLSKAIDNVVEGGFNAVADIPGNDEVGQVSHHIRHMVCRIKELVDEVEEQYKKESVLRNEKYELEMLKKEAELCALQTQINPHFLYNTLEMIKGLLFSEDPRGNILKATRALSNVFRYNLNTDYNVKVKEEIKHIENYLTIHNLRFSKGIELENEMGEDAMESHIVRFTFEPVIENAIIHGFRSSKKENRIRISSMVLEDKRIISVKDNGAGISEEKLEEIRRLLMSGEYSFKADRKGGLGIYNVNGRIKRYFGAGYGLDIRSTVGEGTTVIISVPADWKQNTAF
jgi:two-component system sensor histidine kinase YesM